MKSFESTVREVLRAPIRPDQPGSILLARRKNLLQGPQQLLLKMLQKDHLPFVLRLSLVIIMCKNPGMSMRPVLLMDVKMRAMPFPKRLC